MTHRCLRHIGRTVALFSLLLAHSVSAAPLVSDGYLAVMRHGVRPQTSSKELEKYPVGPWPQWDAADGMLTSHGAKAAAELGKWEARMLQAKKLLPEQGCPTEKDVFAWANGSVQRTIDTGRVVLDSMFPGCSLKIGFNHVESVDPLYAASDAPLGAIDVERAKAAIMQAAGGSFAAMQAKAKPLMAELNAIMGCEAKDRACNMVERPWEIKIKEGKGNKPPSVAVTGPLAEAGTLVQVFLLQYTNGFPADQIAFGKASTAAEIIRLSELRQIKYDLGNRVPYLAARDASNFLNQLLLWLDPQSIDGPPHARFALFMASDTQQAEVATLLGIHWKISPYLDDETPPTGALTFERLHDAAGRNYVKLGFVAPTLDQIRNASAFGEASQPLSAFIDIPGCEKESVEGACPLPRFLELAHAHMDMSAVGEQRYDQ